MFISDTFVVVVVVLLSFLASLYYFGVYSRVLPDFFSAKPDYDERAAEWLSSCLKEPSMTEGDEASDREQNDL